MNVECHPAIEQDVAEAFKRYDEVSPVRGEGFGWYPYQNEPWHWEYNPPGFREIYWADFPGGAPERGIIIDEP